MSPCTATASSRPPHCAPSAPFGPGEEDVHLPAEQVVGVHARGREVREFPLSQAAAALRHAEGGGLAGKVIIVPDAQEHSP